MAQCQVRTYCNKRAASPTISLVGCNVYVNLAAVWHTAFHIGLTVKVTVYPVVVVSDGRAQVTFRFRWLRVFQHKSTSVFAENNATVLVR